MAELLQWPLDEALAFTYACACRASELRIGVTVLGVATGFADDFPEVMVQSSRSIIMGVRLAMAYKNW